jgi:hypothetical protein
MVDPSPWLAMKLIGAWPTTALVTRRVLRRCKEFEGSTPRLMGSENGWWGGEIWLAMNIDSGNGYSSMGVVFQAGRRKSGCGIECSVGWIGVWRLL